MAQVLYVLVSVCPHHCQVKRFWWCQDQKVSKKEVNMQRPSECAEHMVNKERPLCKAHNPHQTTYKISRQKVFCSQNCTKLRISNSFWWLWSDQSTSSFLQLLWTPCVSSVKTSRLVQYKCWRYEEKKKITCLVKKYCTYLFRWPMMIVQTIFSIRIQANYAFYSV